jgi:hypothetical protein
MTILTVSSTRATSCVYSMWYRKWNTTDH